MAARGVGPGARPCLSSRVPGSRPTSVTGPDCIIRRTAPQRFVEGQNLAVIPDGFDADYGHLSELAAALVKAAPDAIIAGPARALQALQSLTHTIPLIGMTEDMVAEGVVASFARPGSNITGISLLSPELDTKRQEILAVPGARKIAAMAAANAAPEYHLQALEHAARSRGVEFLVFRVGGPGEIISAIDAAKASGVEALNFLASPLFSVPGSQTNRVVLDRVAAVRLPSIFQFPETAEAGALAGYGARITDLYSQRARITVQVLRGTKPADIPSNRINSAGYQSEGRKGDWS